MYNKKQPTTHWQVVSLWDLRIDMFEEIQHEPTILILNLKSKFDLNERLNHWIIGNVGSSWKATS